MRTFILILLSALLPIIGYANDLKTQIKQDLLNQSKIGNYQLGKKYILAFPPNESASFGWSDSALEVYVSSPTDTKVNVDVYGKKSSHDIIAGEVLVLDDAAGILKSKAEIREPNKALNKTITLEADLPISVFVLNMKSTTSDGYMAIPVDHWGKEYLH